MTKEMEKAINQDREFQAAVTRNLPHLSAEIRQGWIENPTSLSKVLKEALCPPGGDGSFSVFKTIELGMYESIHDLREHLDDHRVCVHGDAGAVLDKISVARAKTEVVLHVATVRQLTGKKEAYYSEIKEAVISRGYCLCPAEVGPKLIIHHSFASSNDHINILMDPVIHSGEPVFFVISDQFRLKYLKTWFVEHNQPFTQQERFVFASKR